MSQSDPAAINFDFNNNNRGDNLVAKTDFVLSKNHILSARFIYANTTQTEEDAIPLAATSGCQRPARSRRCSV